MVPMAIYFPLVGFSSPHPKIGNKPHTPVCTHMCTHTVIHLQGGKVRKLRRPCRTALASPAHAPPTDRQHPQGNAIIICSPHRQGNSQASWLLLLGMIPPRIVSAPWMSLRAPPPHEAPPGQRQWSRALADWELDWQRAG